MAAPVFDVDVSMASGQVVVAVGGEIDMATGPTLWRAIEVAMAAPGADSLVLDLAETTFMDSTGLGVIIRASGTYGHARVTVRAPQPRVLALFDLTGMRRHINVIEGAGGQTAAGAP